MCGEVLGVSPLTSIPRSAPIVSSRAKTRTPIAPCSSYSPNIIKQSVIHRSVDGYYEFLMTDQTAVDRATREGAIRLTNIDFENPFYPESADVVGSERSGIRVDDAGALTVRYCDHPRYGGPDPAHRLLSATGKQLLDDAIEARATWVVETVATLHEKLEGLNRLR